MSETAPLEYGVSHRDDRDDDAFFDRESTAPTLAAAKSRARRLSEKHGYAVASRYHVNSDHDDELPTRSLLTEWVYSGGRLDFRNDVDAA